MGLIKEPKGVDFIINSEPLTKEQEVKLSEFIAKRKQEIAEMKKHERSKKASGSPPESKRAENVKTKHKSKHKT